jgi:hypothetical protein
VPPAHHQVTVTGTRACFEIFVQEPVTVTGSCMTLSIGETVVS